MQSTVYDFVYCLLAIIYPVVNVMFLALSSTLSAEVVRKPLMEDVIMRRKVWPTARPTTQR